VFEYRMAPTGVRSAVGTIREGRELACDRHRIRPRRVPVNHNFLLAAFALNAPPPAVRAWVELIVSQGRSEAERVNLVDRLDLLARVLRPGDRVLIEDPGYRDGAGIFARAGARVIPLVRRSVKVFSGPWISFAYRPIFEIRAPTKERSCEGIKGFARKCQPSLSTSIPPA